MSWKIYLNNLADQVPKQIEYSPFVNLLESLASNASLGEYSSWVTTDSCGQRHRAYVIDALEISAISTFGSVGSDNTDLGSQFLAGASEKLARTGQSRLSAGAGLISGRNEGSALSLWQSTTPLTISCKTTYNYRCNAFFDVFVPAIAWQSLLLPVADRAGNLIGPGPNMVDVIGTALQNLGGALAEADARDQVSISKKKLKKAKDEAEQKKLNEKINKYEKKLKESQGKKYIGNTLFIGPITLGAVLLVKAKPTFSKNTDTNGYPISAEIELEFITSGVATKSMLLQMIIDGCNNQEFY